MSSLVYISTISSIYSYTPRIPLRESPVRHEPVKPVALHSSIPVLELVCSPDTSPNARSSPTPSRAILLLISLGVSSVQPGCWHLTARQNHFWRQTLIEGPCSFVEVFPSPVQSAFHPRSSWRVHQITARHHPGHCMFMSL